MEWYSINILKSSFLRGALSYFITSKEPPIVTNVSYSTFPKIWFQTLVLVMLTPVAVLYYERSLRVANDTFY